MPKPEPYVLTAQDILTIKTARRIIEECRSELGHISGWFRDLSHSSADLYDLLERIGEPDET